MDALMGILYGGLIAFTIVIGLIVLKFIFSSASSRDVKKLPFLTTVDEGVVNFVHSQDQFQRRSHKDCPRCSSVETSMYKHFQHGRKEEYYYGCDECNYTWR